MSERDLKRLGRAVSDRRTELQLTQAEFARLGNLNLKTVQRVEWGAINPRAKTLGGIDKAAHWRPGSARSVLQGGQPKPLEQESAHDPLAERTEQDIARIRSLMGLSESEREAWVALYLARVRTETEGHTERPSERRHG